MKKALFFILFLILNFGGLAIGNWFMGDAISGQWYTNLNKAPWTPPGWVFGAAWTLIMLCFSVYLTYLFSIRKSKHVITVYVLALVLNISWNYLFFNQKLINWALLNIIILSMTILYFYISFGDDKLSRMKQLLLPYLIWLIIATSLNGYISYYN